MTSLAVAVSVDSRGPSGLYIITDSRITWGGKPEEKRWDVGQKAFASRVSPDVFGFCGDAFFPPTVLRQIIDLIDAELLFYCSDTAKQRHDKAMDIFEDSIQKVIGVTITNFSIFHGSRDQEFMKSKFRMWVTRYDSQTKNLTSEKLCINDGTSHFVILDGSGSTEVQYFKKEWDKTPVEGTSRGMIWSFCRALNSGRDAYSGGPPQLVGIWRKGAAQQFGFIWNGRRYFGGVEVPSDAVFEQVKWFNQKFERYDGRRIRRLAGARPHPQPNRPA